MYLSYISTNLLGLCWFQNNLVRVISYKLKKLRTLNLVAKQAVTIFLFEINFHTTLCVIECQAVCPLVCDFTYPNICCHLKIATWWDFRFFTAASMKVAVFWGVALYSATDNDLRFRGASCLHRPDKGCSMLLWKYVSIYHTAWRRITESSHLQLFGE
jgi:hypothetical protein